jgi:methyltransferase family protein
VISSLGNNEIKWLIPDPPGSLSPDARASYWEKLHAISDYDTVYSMTDDQALRSQIISDLSAFGARSILIPGCGSRTVLQEEIIQRLPQSRVTCLDFPRVVEIAKERFSHPNVTYIGHDVTTAHFSGGFDSVVHVTSVVSESDAENRQIMRATSEALRPEGLMLGVFPTIYATLDIAYTAGEQWRAKNVLLETSSYQESKQGIRQVFYTPLRLRRIAREVQLENICISIFFNDSEYLRSEGRKHYNLMDEDAILYHLYLRATRAPNDG